MTNVTPRTRAAPKCSICQCPNTTKRTCKHCWYGHICISPNCPNKCYEGGYCWVENKCQKLNCETCKLHGMNYGKLIKVVECPDCGHTTSNHYENGAIIEIKNNYSIYSDDEGDVRCHCGWYVDNDNYNDNDY